MGGNFTASKVDIRPNCDYATKPVINYLQKFESPL